MPTKAGGPSLNANFDRVTSRPPEPDPAFNPSDSGAIRRSALLGQRKTRPHTIEKPPAFARSAELRQETPVPVVEIPPPAEPVKAARRRTPAAKTPAPKTPAKAQKIDELQPLREQLEDLKSALSSRPTWEDLRALEARLTAQNRPASNGTIEETAYLELESQLAEKNQSLRLCQEELQTRHEELEELSGIVSEFQEQNEQAQQRIQLLTGRLHELHDQLREAQEDLQLARAQYSHAKEMWVDAEHRGKVGAGFLREALLGLLSPGDEFNEDLVEQIQHFLAL